MRTPKTEVVKARVSESMKKAVLAYAAAVGEVEAVVLREALAEYFSKRKINIGKLSIADQAAISALIKDPRTAGKR